MLSLAPLAASRALIGIYSQFGGQSSDHAADVNHFPWPQMPFMIVGCSKCLGDAVGYGICRWLLLILIEVEVELLLYEIT